MRRANGNIHALKEDVKNPNLLGVALPSEGGLTAEEKDLSRRSKASIDVLHNPFGGDEEEEPEEELEVDLASWGLDSLIPEERATKKSKGAKPERRPLGGFKVGGGKGGGHTQGGRIMKNGHGRKHSGGKAKGRR